MYPQHPLIPPLEDPTTCNNTLTHNSKRQDGSGFIGENGYIFHDYWCCIEVPLGGAYSKITLYHYSIPLFGLIQMLKFVLHIVNFKCVIMSKWLAHVIDFEDML